MSTSGGRPASSSTPMIDSRVRQVVASSMRGVLEDQLGLHVEDPGGVLGALDVAADPEHRLRDPAQHPDRRSAAAARPADCSSRSAGPLGISGAWWRRCGSGRLGRSRGRRARSARRPRHVRIAWVGPASTQVSLEPPPREEFTISSPSASATRVRPPGSTHTRCAVVDRERPQVDVPRRRAGRRRTSAPSTAARPAGRSTTRGSSSTLARSSSSSALVAPRADHDALAARPVDRLEHQLVEPVEDLLARLRLAHPPGVDVAEHRLLGEVVADDVRHVGVDELVVGDAVADRVGERDVAGAGGVDQARAAEHRVGPEVHRVEELVVDPAVDHVHRLEALGGPHHHPAAAALEVAALDQLDAHRAGQQRVLEVGAVVDAGRQHDDRRVGDAGRRRGAQRGEQPLRVAGDRTDPVLGESSPAAPRRSPAGWSSRRRPRTAPARCPRAPGTRRALSRIRSMPGHVHAHAVRRAHVGGRAVVVRRRRDHPARDHAVVEDLPGVVHVGEEQLQRPHPLLDAPLDRRPGVHLDDPRQDVERERPLLAADVEGDALVEVARPAAPRPGPTRSGVVIVSSEDAQPQVRRPQVRRRRTSRRTPVRATP